MSTRSAPHATETLSLWRAVPFLRGLDEEIITALAGAARSRAYEAGEVIFTEEDEVAGLFLIESGHVKISRFSKEGREHIFHIMGRGDTFNEVAALDGGPNPATAVAHTQALLWRVRRDELRRIATAHPALAWALIESIARRTRHLVASVQELAMLNVRGRLARLLLDQAEAFERGDAPYALTQEAMASRLGTVREVLGRALRSLAAEGIIEFDRNRIVIVDRARLTEAAEG